MDIVRASSNRAPIILVYGAEGRGKTTLAAKFPRPLFLLLERGLPRGVSVDAVQGTNSFEGVLRGLREIYEADNNGYETLVVDTVDALETYVLEYVCAANNWKSIETPSFGKGWVAADQTWQRFLAAINWVRDTRGMTVVLTCHATIERVEDPRAPTYTAYAPKLHKRARALVMDAADIVGFLAEDLRVVTDDGGFRERTRAAAGNGRFLFVEGCPAFNAKNRFGMPAKIPIPPNLDIANLTRYWMKGHHETLDDA
jgi:AAA domain